MQVIEGKEVRKEQARRGQDPPGRLRSSEVSARPSDVGVVFAWTLVSN